jgi:hypothetical protein
LLVSTNSIAQTTLYSENFEGASHTFTLNTSDVSSTSGILGVNYWIVNNSYTGGNGTINCPPFGTFGFTVVNSSNQPAGITSNPTSNYMHLVSNAGVVGGVTNANYLAADGLCVLDENNFSKMSSDVSTVGLSNVSFNFWWMCGQTQNSASELYYSIDGGTNWTLLPYFYSGQTNWVYQSVSNSAFDNNSQLRFGFKFVNSQGGSSLDPSFSIDDISITSCIAPSAPTNITASVDLTICSGNSTTLSATGSGNLSWYSAASGGVYLGVGSTFVTPVLTVNSTFYVQDSTCSSSLALTPITVNVIQLPDVTTSLSQVTISANQNGANYQWVDCNLGNSIISGETNQNYTPSSNGDFAVIVNLNGCSDTSACVSIATIGIDENTEALNFSIFPNPSSGSFQINSSAEGLFGITNDLGQTLEIVEINALNNYSVTIEGLCPGIYFLNVLNTQNAISQKIVVTN